MTWWPFAAACATHSLNRFLSPELGSSDVRVQSYGPGAQNFLHTEQGTITRARPDRRLPGRVRHGVSGCRVGGAVQARDRRHGDRRRILRRDEHRLNDGPNGETIPRRAGVCGATSATSRRSRTGLSRATGSTSTCETGSRSSVSRPSPGRSPRSSLRTDPSPEFLSCALRRVAALT